MENLLIGVKYPIKPATSNEIHHTIYKVLSLPLNWNLSASKPNRLNGAIPYHIENVLGCHDKLRKWKPWSHFNSLRPSEAYMHQ